MKKILWFALALAMTLAFVSCEEEGPSMNEDYAGVWYIDMGTDGVLKMDMTDTTFAQSIKAVGGTEYVNYEKGTITKISDGVASLLTTHEWDTATSAWVEVTDTAEQFTYTLSADGTTLTIVAEGNTMPFSSTEP